MNIQIYCISFCIFIGTCSASKKVPDFNKYLEYKNRFDSTLTMHFPEYPLAENYIATLHTESKKNNVWFVLVYPDLSSDIYDSISRVLLEDKYIASYLDRDTCILYINPFETKTTLEMSTFPLLDSNIIEKPCYKGQYPIPNLFNKNEDIYFADIGLENMFEVYVIEANRDKKYHLFNMDENVQMPVDWKNGYSFGFALNQTNNSIIYWLAMW